MCAQKLTNSQLNLPHGTKQKKSNEETVRSQSPWSQSWGRKGVYDEKDL